MLPKKTVFSLYNAKNLFSDQVKFCHFIVKKPFFKQALLDSKDANIV